jgi:outer membrane protein assembly factor BamA
LSDLLNDHLVFASVSSYQGSEFGSIFSNINADAIYLNQSRRLNWGLGAFRHQGANFEGDNSVAYNEETVGVMGVIRYPLSRYNRIEASMVVEYSDRFDFTLPVDELRREGLITSHFVSFVRDNSLWTLTGPIDGGRLSVTAGVSSDFSNARFDSFLLSADWRKYLRLGSKSAYAVRAVGFYSGGDRPRRIYMGGTSGMRGYPLFGRIVGSRAFMLNQEVRFPLLDYLTFGTPVGALRFPEVQGAFFLDVGKAWFPQGSDRATLGSVGIGLRWALWPFAVVRLDAGRRFSSDDFQGYGLTRDETTAGFVSLWFGFNY